MALGAAAKCGSTTLAHLVVENNAGVLVLHDARYNRKCWSLVPKGYRQIGVVRHPVARFWSLYENVQSRKRSASNFYAQFEGKSPLQLLDAISADLDYDFHFQPQGRIGLNRPCVELVRLEALNEWWDKNRPEGATGMPAANQGGGLAPADHDTTAVVAPLVCELYADDYALWERAYGNPSPSTNSARPS